jgi:hypothetical protein
MIGMVWINAVFGAGKPLHCRETCRM